ncbi:unnamed protein product [Effrenium voratum]|uniref:Uncharacterized protein n=1 Tax=Effrenium voratum TaxID=2562239 RepID=A0AA36NHY6_9DINO|nr:unnamed protein product [Effrenium voratum]
MGDRSRSRSRRRDSRGRDERKDSRRLGLQRIVLPTAELSWRRAGGRMEVPETLRAKLWAAVSRSRAIRTKEMQATREMAGK